MFLVLCNKWYISTTTKHCNTWQLSIDNVSQGLLSVVGDSDGTSGLVVINVDPLVFLGKVKRRAQSAGVHTTTAA